jgi:hypothetical protein
MYRDPIVEALWPDVRAAAATNSLHQTLHSRGSGPAMTSVPRPPPRSSRGIHQIGDRQGLAVAGAVTQH